MKKLRNFLFVFIFIMVCSLIDTNAASYVKNPNVKSCIKTSGGSCEFGGYNSPNTIEVGSQIQYNVNSTLTYNFVVLEDNNRVITMFYNGSLSAGNQESIANYLNASNWDNVIDMSNSYREFSQSTGISFSKRRIMTVDEANIFKSICGSNYIESSVTCNVSSDKYYWIMDNTSLKYLSKQGTVASPNGTAAYVLPIVEIYKFTEDTSSIPGSGSGSSTSEEKIQELETQLETLQKQLQEANKKLEELESSKSKVSELETQLGALQGQLQEANNKISDLQNSTNTSLADLTSKLNDLISQLNKINGQISQTDGTGTIDDGLKKQIADLTNRITELEKQIASILKNNGNNNSNIGSQTVSVVDTFKNAYLLYCIGTVVLVLAFVVFYQFYKKDKESKEEINIKKD